MDNFDHILEALQKNDLISFRDAFHAGMLTGLTFFCSEEEIAELEFSMSYSTPNEPIFAEWLNKIRARLGITDASAFGAKDEDTFS